VKGLEPTLISAIAIGLLAGSAVGVTAQDEADPMATSSFYGSLVSETDSSLVIEMTDPRASGELSFAETRVEIPIAENGSAIGWSSTSARLANEKGSWSGTTTEVGTSWGVNNFKWLLTGEGGYEGLTMMLGWNTEEDNDDLWGAIVPTDAIPPHPEPPAE
jgi:hypothetical protein